jgi:hypothetical protein
MAYRAEISRSCLTVILMVIDQSSSMGHRLNSCQTKSKFLADVLNKTFAYAKANSGKVNYALGGNGTAQHLSGELFKMMTGVVMVHVPYRGDAPRNMSKIKENFDVEGRRASRRVTSGVTESDRSARLAFAFRRWPDEMSGQSGQSPAWRSRYALTTYGVHTPI